jgi:outer membrane protein TolC
MKRNPYKLIAALSFTMSLLASGCMPTKPIYLNDTGNLNHFVDQATAIEYPDLETRTLDEVEQALAPITVKDPDFQTYRDVTLEEAVGYALQNGKVFRGYGTPSLQGTRVSPGVDNLINGITAAGTIYDVAIRESEPGFIGTPGQISSPGSVTTNTALDGNQGVEAALADFDAQFTSSVSWLNSDEPRNTVFNNPNTPLVFQQDQVQFNAEIAKKSANGTQLFFRNVSTYTDNSNPLQLPGGGGGFQILDSVYRTAFEAEIRQPLLRGRGAFINRMPIVISRISTDQQIANLEAQLQNYVTNVEVRYWDLYCAYRNLDAAKTGRNAAIETWRIVKDQFDEGSEVNIQQVAQAAEQYHFFDAQVIDAYNNVLNAEGAMRFLLGWSSTDGQMLRPIDEPVMAPLEFEWCNTLCEALTYRPELRQERWEIKKRELALAYSKNSLLPELNVSGTYRWLGNGDVFGDVGSSPAFPNDGSGALNNLYGGNFQEFALNAEFRMPVGFRRELANVRNAQLKLAREIARLEDAELEVSKELSEAFRALQANQSIMQSSFNRWKETRIESDHFEELEIEGVETLDVALDAQRRQSQAEIAFYTAVCEYNKVIALIHRRKGTTLPHAGIHFTEGAWAGKAYDDAHENARRRSAAKPLDYGWSRPNVISRGGDSPSDQNAGNLSAGNAAALGTQQTGGYQTDSYPSGGYESGGYEAQYAEPIYQGQIIEGQAYEGEYYNGSQGVPIEIQPDSYSAPQDVIESPMLRGTPAPAAMPYSGSQTRNVPTPTQPRRRPKQTLRQVNYEQPVASSAVVLKASTQRRKSRPKASSDNRSTQPRNPQPQKQSTASVAKITRPTRDTNVKPMKRLQATTRPLRSASSEVPTAREVQEVQNIRAVSNERSVTNSLR